MQVAPGMRNLEVGQGMSTARRIPRRWRHPIDKLERCHRPYPGRNALFRIFINIDSGETASSPRTTAVAARAHRIYFKIYYIL